jgi:hypothetical protein
MQTLAAAAARSTSAAIPAGARGLATKVEHFPGIDKIKYEGEKSMNPLAFKHYRPDEKVLGKVCDAPASGAVALNSDFEAGAAVTAGALSWAQRGAQCSQFGLGQASACLFTTCLACRL